MPRTRRQRSRRTRKQKGGSQEHTVVMIETRKVKSMPLVLRTIFENLGPEWKLLIFHGPTNKEWLENILDTQFKKDRARVSLKDCGRTRIDIPEYNRMMMGREILDQIPTEMFLVVQTDSILCKGKGHLLKDFMNYDYVGAPWRDRQRVGNGGLSLRRKSKMIQIADKCAKLDHMEDGFFAYGCDGARPKVPEFDVAKRFAIESVYHPESFGVHKPHHHLPEMDKELKQQCEGYDELHNLMGQED